MISSSSGSRTLCVPSVFFSLALAFTTSLHATVALKSEWSPCWPSPTIENLFAVASVGRTIVITGGQGTVLTSPDGESWNRTRIRHGAGDMVDLWQMASSNKEVVVASNVSGVVWTSTDGTAWTPRSTGVTAMAYRLTYSAGRYVALGTTGAGRSPETVIMSSPDGVIWNAQTVNNSGLSLHDVIWTGGQYVAIGIQNSKWEIAKTLFGKAAKLDTPVTAVSSDGRSWNVTELSPGARHSPRPKALSWNGSLFVLGCDSGTTYTSTDGTTWLPQGGSPTEISLMSVTWSGGRFTAVGSDTSPTNNGKAAIWTSPDGVRWNKEKAADSRGALSKVAWTGNQFVAVGWGGQIHVSSGDGTWQRKSPLGGDGDLRRIISNGSLLIAVGHQTSLTSVDGKQWISHAVPADFSVNSITWDGGKFVAVGAKGVVFTSSNGHEWRSESSGTLQDLTDITWTGSRLVCVGIDDSMAPSGSLALESNDGSKWVVCQTPRDTGGLHAVIWTGQQLVAAGKRGSILTSPDGHVWSKQRGGDPVLPDIEAIAWSGKTLVAVGRAGASSGTKAVLCSQDGITWTEHPGTGPILLFGITWAGDRFIAVGERGIVNISNDGYSWIYDSPCTTQTLAHVCWDGKAAYAVGTRETIITAFPSKP